jgi:hypothetical protein
MPSSIRLGSKLHQIRNCRPAFKKPVLNHSNGAISNERTTSQKEEVQKTLA